MNDFQKQPSGAQQALAVMRARTGPLHQQLDSGSLLTRLTQPDCKLDDYVAATEALWAAYHGLDACLLAAAAHCPPGLPPYQARTPLLATDLHNLGRTLALPPVCSLAAPANTTDYLGMRYVVEGAVLGARVIHRFLSQSTLAAHMPVETCFWACVQADASAWPVLIRQLSQLHDAKAIDEAAHRACAVFAHFIRHLVPERIEA